jgi:multidrug efflux pump
VSLTLTPMMCAYLLKPGSLPTGDEAAMENRRGFYARMLGWYEWSLDWVLVHRRTTILIAAASVAVTVFLYVVIPKDLLPEQDTGLITGVVQADSDVAFPAMERHIEAVTAALRRDPAVAGVSSFVGAGAVNPTLNQGQVSIVLKPRGERGGLADVVASLQRAVAGVPGVELFLKPVQDITLDTTVAPTEYQYALSEIDPNDLAKYAQRVVQAVKQLPELADVSDNLAMNGRALKLDIDRTVASRLGVPVQTIDDTLYDAYGQRQISTIFTQQNQYRVILEVQPQFRNRSDLMNMLRVRSNGASGALIGSNATSLGMLKSANSSTATGFGQSNTGIILGGGNTVPLSTLASATVTDAPLVIAHQNQLPAVIISFNVAPGYSLSQAVEAINRTTASLDLPPQVRAGFIGKAAEFSSSLGNEALLLLAAIVVIYIVLGVLYESYIHPFTILSTLPPAGVGALLALMIFGMPLSVDGIVGIVLLIGIVKKNAIMMIDFAITAKRRGMNAHDAIRRACLLRFRPIMMTTFAALFGALPLALGNGIGAELRRPLGVAIVGGLLLSQLVTLYTTPVIYLYMERFGEWVRQRAARGHAELASESGERA